MSGNEPMTEERVALITERIDEVRRFLRDIVEDPRPLQVIPTGSTLRHRTVQMNDRRLQLTAYRLLESEDPWTARVTSWDSPDELGVDGSRGNVVSAADSMPRASPQLEDDQLVVHLADTADAALDALERLILEQRAPLARA